MEKKVEELEMEPEDESKVEELKEIIVKFQHNLVLLETHDLRNKRR